MKYYIQTRETGLAAWPYAAAFGIDDSGTLIGGWWTKRDEINNWLIMQRIRYQYKQGLMWHFKSQEDLTLFLLRWGE